MSGAVVQFTLRNGKVVSIAMPDAGTDKERFEEIRSKWQTRTWARGERVEFRFEYREIAGIEFLEES